MENALFISKPEHLKYWEKKYTHIYYGIEFCERLIPSVNELNKVLGFVKKKKIRFSLVTPYVTDAGIKKIKPLFKKLKKIKKNIGIIINDWGVFELAKNNGFTMVLGRLLTKQKRGPRILNIMHKLPKGALEHFQSSNVDTNLMQEFLLKKKIYLIEIDNLLQGIKLNLKNSKIKASLYYPYAYVTTTRFCLAAGCENENNIMGIKPCKKECQKYTFKLTTKDMPVPLLLKGNTQFFINNKLPKNLEKMGIKRLIYQPEIPI